MSRCTFLIAVMLCACGPSEVPLSIASVEPQSVSASESVLLAVNLEGALPLELDYGKDSAEIFSVTRVVIGNREVPVIRREEKGQRLIVEILPGLTVGVQDLQVTFQDGRHVVLEKGFEVKPHLTLTGFQIDTIPTQVLGRPFSITLRAVGPDAALFQGRVKLYSTQGTVVPDASQQFEAGVLTQEITVTNPNGPMMSISVDDYAGRFGRSNDFNVNRP